MRACCTWGKAATEESQKVEKKRKPGKTGSHRLWLNEIGPCLLDSSHTEVYKMMVYRGEMRGAY